MPEKFHELRLAARTAALRGCSMFADLAPGDLERIAQFVEVRRASRGDYLFHEGETARGFFIIRQGAVAAETLPAPAHRCTVRDRARCHENRPRLRAEHAQRNALARLRDAGQIAVHGKRIRVLSPQRLEVQFRANLGEAT